VLKPQRGSVKRPRVAGTPGGIDARRH
jgi:hypothetical protein